TEVAVTDTANNFTATDVEGALAELALESTDDQALSLATGNILTLEDGGTVNLTPFLDNTDDQEITAFSLDNTTNVLTLTLEDGGTETVDFTTVLAAAGTDSQDLSLTGDDLTLTNDPTATAIDLSAYRETVSGINDITVTDDGAGNFIVDYVDGDKDSTNELTQTGSGGPSGSPVNGTTYVDTDTGQMYVYEDSWKQVGGSATPAADIVTTLATSDNVTYTYTSENNTTTSFDGTDDQDASEVSYDDATSSIGAVNVQEAIEALVSGSTDDQALSLAT
ncbi:hypothetical protein I2486_21670, partial [Cellulophaga sp. E16_2]|uniref:hypothetical protein n=1 Tax=Cellulophaga sp. E16_2 TaxID=2789297 RepID=UPI001A90EF82